MQSFMAALLHTVNPPPELREKYERVNIGGTATVVEAAIKGMLRDEPHGREDSPSITPAYAWRMNVRTF